MNISEDKIDDTVLALLYLTSFKQGKSYPWQAWQSMDWDAMDRLHEKGFISDPKNKNKSIVFTEEGYELSKQLFERLFCDEEDV